MMESFKVYLPSNACPHLFPDNTPTDYRIRFDKPIDLNGQWEVGVESVLYSSRINDDKERSEIVLNVETTVDKTVNSLYPYEFITTSPDPDIGVWKGFRGIVPTYFETDFTKIESVIKTLNDMNYDMLNPEKERKNGHIFYFSLDKDNHVEYECSDSTGFVLQLTNEMAKLLGFDYVSVLYGRKMKALLQPQFDKKDPLKQGAYLLRYLNTNVQESQKRIYLKVFGAPFVGKEDALLKLWEKTVTSSWKIKAEFKSEKLILHNWNAGIGIRFSPEFSNRFCHPAPFFGKGSRWAFQAPKWTEGTIEQEQWYVDIYTEKMETTEQKAVIDVSLELYPWRSASMKKLIYLINTKMVSLLKLNLENKYDAAKYRFELTFDDVSGHCNLILGPMLHSCNLSKNLSYLLGFKSDEIRERASSGVRKADSLTNHSRQLHLISNVIQPTAYGKHQRQILCDFLHVRDLKPITGKRFDPISYHPVARSGIDMIHLRLTDDTYNNISIQDATTIVTLYFRKVKRQSV
ncbi:MAG: hypothetical protein AAFN63_17235 [Pseudomonadota bacterium]